jgi:hypothetical protein
MEFERLKFNCPWFSDFKCSGMVSYNQHVNDMRLAGCQEWTCPIVYWVRMLEEKIKSGGE